MASRQRKVEQRRLKRRKKQRSERVFALRHQQRLAGDAHPIHACLANADWQEHGKASILFARDVAPGRVTMAAFLVDLWAMGLKDAWGRVDLGISEFNDVVATQRERTGVCPMDVGTARHVVYGGIQLAGELGFRLPRKYERWTAILGPLPQGESPDMSLFLVDGKIRLMCSARDFEARLIGTSVENFLSRPDVEYCLGNEDFTLVDDEDDEFVDALTELEEATLDRVRQWCFANGEQPHPLLPLAIGATLEAVVQALPPDLDPDLALEALPKPQQDEMLRQTAAFLSASSGQDPAAMEAAMAQFCGFMESTGSPEQFFDALDLPKV